MSTPSTKPIACQDCVRSMGNKCLAMAKWEPNCWAYTTDPEQVIRELTQAITYVIEHRGDHRDLLGYIREIERRFGRREES